MRKPIPNARWGLWWPPAGTATWQLTGRLLHSADRLPRSRGMVPVARHRSPDCHPSFTRGSLAKLSYFVRLIGGLKQPFEGPR